MGKFQDPTFVRQQQQQQQQQQQRQRLQADADRLEAYAIEGGGWT